MGRVLGAIFYGLAALTAIVGLWLMLSFDGGPLPGAGTVAFVSIGVPTFGSALGLLFFGYVCFALDEIVERLGAVRAPALAVPDPVAPVLRPTASPSSRPASSVRGKVAG